MDIQVVIRETAVQVVMAPAPALSVVMSAPARVSVVAAI
jgi:hypothetical protein